MCDEHAAQWTAWLDHRMPAAPIQLCTPGVSSVRDVLWVRKSRVDDHINLIRSQQSLIKNICERTCHV
jgi:hypothetical protein